jgi:hypothetical protein
LDFDQSGSSHSFRKINDSVKKTAMFHCLSTNNLELDAKSTVVITGDNRHYLDYYNNQLYKQSKGNLTDYLIGLIGLEKIQLQLKQGWGYQGSFDANTPRWIIREHCSFWISDALVQAFSNSVYLSTPHVYSFCCQDLWTADMWQLINNLATVLSQKIHAPKLTVQHNHQMFLGCQQYHDIQIQCEQFVLDTINMVESNSPCTSMLDEAYVQHTLRKQGYEIRCQDLDHFPRSSNQLAKIIYETSNNSN